MKEDLQYELKMKQVEFEREKLAVRKAEIEAGTKFHSHRHSPPASSWPETHLSPDRRSYQFNFNSTPHGQSLSPPRPSNLSPPNYLYGHRDSMYEYGMAESTAFGANTTNPSPSRPKVAAGRPVPEEEE
jgi:hypothetical protein